ncbi:hypothetical protein D3C80_1429710 [compost metagenome]
MSRSEDVMNGVLFVLFGPSFEILGSPGFAVLCGFSTSKTITIGQHHHLCISFRAKIFSIIGIDRQSFVIIGSEDICEREFQCTIISEFFLSTDIDGPKR